MYFHRSELEKLPHKVLNLIQNRKIFEFIHFPCFCTIDKNRELKSIMVLTLRFYRLKSLLLIWLKFSELIFVLEIVFLPQNKNLFGIDVYNLVFDWLSYFMIVRQERRDD